MFFHPSRGQSLSAEYSCNVGDTLLSSFGVALLLHQGLHPLNDSLQLTISNMFLCTAARCDEHVSIICCHSQNDAIVACCLPDTPYVHDGLGKGLHSLLG